MLATTELTRPGVLITHDQSPLASAFDLPGKLSLSVTEANVALIATELRETITTAAGAHARLKMDALEDLLVTVHYVAG
jgi:hypothetical protein